MPELDERLGNASEWLSDRAVRVTSIVRAVLTVACMVWFAWPTTSTALWSVTRVLVVMLISPLICIAAWTVAGLLLIAALLVLRWSIGFSNWARRDPDDPRPYSQPALHGRPVPRQLPGDEERQDRQTARRVTDIGLNPFW
jgi:hypothetical protein